MKLSEAILLGDTLKKCNASVWIKSDGSCGCALGGALLAAGFSAREIVYQIEELDGNFVANYSMGHLAELPAVKATWPWLTVRDVHQISIMYQQVERRDLKIENIAEYIRSIEPQDEPTNVVVEVNEKVECLG